MKSHVAVHISCVIEVLVLSRSWSVFNVDTILDIDQVAFDLFMLCFVAKVIYGCLLMYMTSTDITSILYLDIDNNDHGFWVLFNDKVDTDFNLMLTLSLKNRNILCWFMLNEIIVVLLATKCKINHRLLQLLQDEYTSLQLLQGCFPYNSLTVKIKVKSFFSHSA